jgi:hypothetical protein
VRKRQPLRAALPARSDLTGTPVDVIKREVGDLANPHPQPCEEHHDRVVPPSDDRAAVTGIQDPPHLTGSDPLRQSRQANAGDRRHRPGQRPLELSLAVKESEHLPDRDDSQLR